MKGAAMASFQSAAEVPDRDDDEEHPDVDCGHCGAYLGTHPCDEYVDCEECGGATLSRWAPEPEGPSDEDIAQCHAAIAAANERESAAVANDIANDLVLSALFAHPLPWRVEQDWTHEVTAADGTIIAKCMTYDRAAAIVTLAQAIRAELDSTTMDDAAVCGEGGDDDEA